MSNKPDHPGDEKKKKDSSMKNSIDLPETEVIRYEPDGTEKNEDEKFKRKKIPNPLHIPKPSPFDP